MEESDNFDYYKSKIYNKFESPIDDIVTKAIGCKSKCNFCNRKCELEPHNSSIKHSCKTVGH